MARDRNGDGEDAPLYARLATALREDIARGVHEVGAQLPSEGRLSERFGVSRHTVREALRRLREEGLIASRRGSGSVVAMPHGDQAHILHAMSIGDLIAFASDAQLVLDDVGLATVDDGLSARAGIVPGEEWLVARGTRRTSREEPAVCVAEYLIDRRFAAIASLLPPAGRPIFSLIEERFAVRVAEVEQEIGASPIGAAKAAALDVEPGAIGLEVRRTYRLRDRSVAQVTLNTHPASRFRHSMTMHRRG